MFVRPHRKGMVPPCLYKSTRLNAFMRLKDVPEDFFVEEIPKRKFTEQGKLFVYTATKRDLTTNEMITKLSRLNGVQPRDIRFAGLKDRRAITTQYITSPKALTKSPDNVILTLKGKTDEHLSLGDMQANAFRIVVRDVKDTHDVVIPNYFGDQRFSKDNVEIGLLILKKDFYEVAKRLAEENPAVADRLEQDRSSPIQALQVFPFRILLLYVHAVQSWLYNEAVSAYIKDNHPDAREVPYRHGVLRFPKELKDQEVPVVGAVQELGEWEKYYAPLLNEAGITQQDFLIRSFPSLTQEGETRSLLADVKSHSIKREGPNAIVEVVLGSGCYATVCVDGWCS